MKYTKPNHITVDHLVADFAKLYQCRRNKAYNRIAYLLSLPMYSGAPVAVVEEEILAAHGITCNNDEYKPIPAVYGTYREKAKEFIKIFPKFTHGMMVDGLWDFLTYTEPKPQDIATLERILIAHKNATTAAIRHLVDRHLLVNCGDCYMKVE